MGRVHVGKQVAHRHRVHPGGIKVAGGGADRVFIEGGELRALKIQPARNLERTALRCDRRGPIVKVVEGIAVAGLVLGFLHGIEPGVDQQAHTGAPHFKKGVGGDGGAVGEEADGGGRDARVEKAFDATEHALGRVGRGGGNLFHPRFTADAVEQYQVGMGATHIDAEPKARCPVFSRHVPRSVSENPWPW